MNEANPELQLAGEYVRETGCHLFLTGKAGTGKTTFLHTLREDCPKRLVVTAPTGVAAINAGGVTLHSFFQLPFGPFVPGSEAAHSRYRFTREKIDIIRNLDLLVIDEISMVRADLLDGVDSVLRRFRSADQPFGGVQLLMIGDLHQLPPVIRDEDWRLLRQIYESPYFFSSAALRQAEMITIELQRIYRQVDGHFINLLNRVRNDQLDPAALRDLNRRHIPDFAHGETDGYITLCTHNRHADAINEERLEALPKQVRTFEARIEGDFPEHAYPTAATLNLKPGAQVMFARNDPSPEKRYFNGKIGTITRITGTEVRIRCPEDAGEIAVEPTTWENIEYTLDRETLAITENKIGAFRQFPLRLAWAITIHKSQGLTFDRAIIDAQAAFAHGQVYVALSRCRTLEGLVLSTPLSSTAIRTDAVVRRFSETAQQNPPTPDRLHGAKIQYQQRLLMECFNFQRLCGLLSRMTSLLLSNSGIVQVSGGVDLRTLQQRTEEEIGTVGEKFVRQLQGLFPAATPPANDAVVLERIAKASVYFQEKIASGPGSAIPALQIDSDNKAILRKINQARKRLQEEIDAKLAAVGSCRRGFSPAGYFRAVSAAATDTGKRKRKPEAATYSEADIAHPELFETLKAWRSEKARREGLPHYRVMHQKTLIQIAVCLPESLTALEGIKGIGKRLVQRYGGELVALVGAYRRKHRIEPMALPAPSLVDSKPREKKHPGIDTKQVTLELFERGLSPLHIAAERGLVLATIEGHLAHFVETGGIAIDRLMPAKKRQRIERELSRASTSSLREIKQVLGADVSYGEIRLVQAHRRRLLSDPPSDMSSTPMSGASMPALTVMPDS